MKLLTVEDARARMLAAIEPSSSETVALAGAAGRFLAADIHAGRSQPPFAASSMDGWAVRAADTPGRLAIVGESAAGRGFEGAIGPGQAVRIFTGAATPPGADAVVIQEDAAREGDEVLVPAADGPSLIRPAGQDFRAGDRLLAAGVRLDPWRVALAAAAGLAEVEVAGRPKVAILSTGEEIIPAGGAPGPFQIFDSGGPALTALAAGWGAEAVFQAIVGDSTEAIAAAVSPIGADLIVILGGASVGDYDLVKPALASLGLTLVVESIAMRPGKPTWFGRLGDDRRVLGLPGNPASAMACAELFLKPLLLAMQGADPGPRLIAARAIGPLGPNGPREHWMRAALSHSSDGVLMAEPFADQDSGLVRVFAGADALLRRRPNAPAVRPGEAVDVLPLGRL